MWLKVSGAAKLNCIAVWDVLERSLKFAYYGACQGHLKIADGLFTFSSKKWILHSFINDLREISPDPTNNILWLHWGIST